MGVQLASVGRVGSLAAASITAIRTGRLHGDGHVSLLNVPMFHIAGIGGMPPSLMLGATTVIMPTAPFDAEATLDVIESEGVTSLFLVRRSGRCCAPSYGRGAQNGGSSV